MVHPAGGEEVKHPRMRLGSKVPFEGEGELTALCDGLGPGAGVSGVEHDIALHTAIPIAAIANLPGVSPTSQNRHQGVLVEPGVGRNVASPSRHAGSRIREVVLAGVLVVATDLNVVQDI